MIACLGKMRFFALILVTALNSGAFATEPTDDRPSCSESPMTLAIAKRDSEMFSRALGSMDVFKDPTDCRGKSIVLKIIDSGDRKNFEIAYKKNHQKGKGLCLLRSAIQADASDIIEFLAKQERPDRQCISDAWDATFGSRNLTTFKIMSKHFLKEVKTDKELATKALWQIPHSGSPEIVGEALKVGVLSLRNSKDLKQAKDAIELYSVNHGYTDRSYYSEPEFKSRVSAVKQLILENSRSDKLE